MRTHSDKLCVPTLDVDLAWHTHQTMPASYYAACTSRGGTKFIDHDDKIREDKLSEAFEWTSKVYQENFNEVYSECTCWYCETVRASHVSSVGRVLKMSGNEKSTCPPEQIIPKSNTNMNSRRKLPRVWRRQVVPARQLGTHLNPQRGDDDTA
jgi:hypothetical protein